MVLHLSSSFELENELQFDDLGIVVNGTSSRDEIVEYCVDCVKQTLALEALCANHWEEIVRDITDQLPS